MTVADYRVTVKVRNNRILKAAENIGLSIPMLAEKIGANYCYLNDLVNMVRAPFGRDGSVLPWVDKLCDVLNVPFDDLFSEQQREALVTNRSEREVAAEEVQAIISSFEQKDAEMLLANEQMNATLDLALSSSLNQRERFVLERRYGIYDGEEWSLERCGVALDVTRERIRQIEAKALRKMRQPSVANRIRPENFK